MNRTPTEWTGQASSTSTTKTFQNASTTKSIMSAGIKLNICLFFQTENADFFVIVQGVDLKVLLPCAPRNIDIFYFRIARFLRVANFEGNLTVCMHTHYFGGFESLFSF